MPDASTSDTRSVEELIIERAKAFYARMPMLEVVFERFALSLAPALKTYFGAMTDVKLKSVDYLSCESALSTLPDPALVAITDAREWSSAIAVIVKTDLLFAVIEVTMGGRQVEGSPRQARSLTGIEKRIGQKLCELALDDLSRAFLKIAPVSFEVNHLETNPQTLLLAPPNSAAVRFVLEVEIEDRRGELVFVLPNAAFEPVADVLSQAFTGGTLGGDTGWRSSMTAMLNTTGLHLDAVMCETVLPLREVLAWVPGTVLELSVQADEPLTLSSGGKPVARAEVGKRNNGRIALKLTEKLYDTEEPGHVLSD